MMMRPHRPPPRPFPIQSRLECPSALFERVTQASDAQYAAQVARDSLPLPTPKCWHDYHPTPTPPIPISPSISSSSAPHGSPPTPLSRFPSMGNVADALGTGPSTPVASQFPYAPSPYPPAAPTPTPVQRLSNLFPFSSAGSTSTIYKTVIKRPALVQLYLNGDELHTNAPDVESSFLAELRAYRVPGQHANIVAFLGCLDAVGMVLECVEGDTFFERVIKKRTSCPSLGGHFSEQFPAVTPRLKVEWFNQIVDALVHVHRHGLSHGDINTLNVLITYPTSHPPNAIKLIDFGRSTYFNPLPPTTTAASAVGGFGASRFGGPTTMGTGGRGPISSFHMRHPSIGGSSGNGAGIASTPFVNHLPPSEVPQPSAHPFAAPELLRGGKYIDPVTKKRVPCDGRLADAYSLGVLLWCLDDETLVDLDRDLQKKEEVMLFNIPDDDHDTSTLDEDPGYGAGDEEDFSIPPGLAEDDDSISVPSSPEDKEKMVLDEGYHSADAAWKRRMKASMLAKSRPHRGRNLTPMGTPRLFTKLIKGYMKKWEERTRISIEQKMIPPT